MSQWCLAGRGFNLESPAHISITSCQISAADQGPMEMRKRRIYPLAWNHAISYHRTHRHLISWQPRSLAIVYLQPLSCYSISSSGHSECLPGSHQSHMLMQQVAIGIQLPPPSIGAKKFAHPHRNYFIYRTSLTAPQGLLCNPIRRRDSQYPHKPPFHLLRLSRHSILP